jgi:hypothetical protein
MVLLCLAAVGVFIDAVDGTGNSTRQVLAELPATTTNRAEAATTAPDNVPRTSAAASVLTSQHAQTMALINSLVVAAPYRAQPYRRAAFGEDWIDADNDCQNTRAEVLVQETAVAVTFNSNGCTVNTGSWIDPWSGFISTSAADFQIDHTVPLADAWRSGASQWDDAKRLRFANDLADPDALNALRGTINTSKSDKSPDQWQPPLRSAWCRYATAWARIKSTWQLTVTAPELSALETMAAECG